MPIKSCVPMQQRFGFARCFALQEIFVKENLQGPTLDLVQVGAIVQELYRVIQVINSGICHFD